jgi:hypothetical protein
MLCRFVSAGLDGLYELRLQVGNGIVVSSSSDPVTVLIDNKVPSLYRFAGETIPNVGVTVKNACGLYKGTEDITVWGNFEDDHYAYYQLSLVGGGITSPQSLPSPAVGASGTFPAGDFLTGQVLTTFKMPDVHPEALKCAYAILITVHDHTIAGYAGHYAFDTYPVYIPSSVTFDWEP